VKVYKLTITKKSIKLTCRLKHSTVEVTFWVKSSGFSKIISMKIQFLLLNNRNTLRSCLPYTNSSSNIWVPLIPLLLLQTFPRQLFRFIIIIIQGALQLRWQACTLLGNTWSHRVRYNVHFLHKFNFCLEHLVYYKGTEKRILKKRQWKGELQIL
jgi:hypothetical protein